MKKTNHAKGHRAEKWAMLYLMLKGWRPIARNYVTGRGTGAGEIDLIMARGKNLAFIEVKYRPTLVQALEAITPETQIRIARASAGFLKRYPEFQQYQIRYDAVLMGPRRWPKHLQGAWRIL
jgi:putative endonuclease